ncbi:uncharacterized protein MELLADRAFT_103397 [Melampsora larici-populina 98AG31]|uniref:Uncharacterized protein n=1 Tax=Melampsora larici-populina (strain 98AG31 / pathotype 3-4-7) TaxID=747676 RepID=F4RBC2_MELLP|nr:uncharacterized protein MELLADRAFT_103397 [Melampsora larici-populina 98AG31]EGG10386.1 hypothetical protein MELLADRAFT_103397 [Melampsora larici-populina 98AG31]
MTSAPTPSHTEDASIFNLPKKITKRKFSANVPLVCKKTNPIRLSVPMIDLVVIFLGKFAGMFRDTYANASHMLPDALFDREDAWQVVKNYEAIHNGVFIREILGGETLPDMWMKSPVYLQHQAQLEEEQIRLEQGILDAHLIEEEHKEQNQLKQLAINEKRAAIAERKQIQTQKALEKQAEKYSKLKQRQQLLGSELFEICHRINWSFL